MSITPLVDWEDRARSLMVGGSMNAINQLKLVAMQYAADYRALEKANMLGHMKPEEYGEIAQHWDYVAKCFEDCFQAMRKEL